MASWLVLSHNYLQDKHFSLMFGQDGQLAMRPMRRDGFFFFLHASFQDNYLKLGYFSFILGFNDHGFHA